MTTITLKSAAPLSRTSFRDFDELRSKLAEDEVFEVVLEQVPRNKITPDLRKKMQAAMALPESAWHRM